MKTLRVTLADIVGPTGTPNSTATVHARYVDPSGRGRDVHLTDGTIVVPVRRVSTGAGDPEVFDFDVYPNDVAPVREVDYGVLVEVSWTVVAPTGAKSSGAKRVAITDDMDAVVQLGLLATPTPVPPYTGGYSLPGHKHVVGDITATGTPSASTYLRGDGSWSTPAGGGGGGVSDHGALTGLGDDDHTQYALANGTRGAFAAPLGADDNYVTDAEKAALHAHSNKAALDLVSGTNTGDQVLPTWSTISGKPAVVAAGATQADARTAIGAGTSSFSGAYADLSGKPTLGTAAATASTDYAPAAHTTSTDHDDRYVVVVEHGAVAGTARPAGATVVLWVGSVEPTNAISGDQWDDASGAPSVYIEEPASEGTPGQVLTTDGAGGRTWTTVSGGGGSVATDAIWDAKGDLVGGTGANTSARLAVGTNGHVLTADSAETTGMKWAAPSGGSSPAYLPMDPALYGPPTGSGTGVEDVIAVSTLELFYMPTWVAPCDYRITGARINVTAIGAGTLIYRLGLATMDTDDQPLALAADWGDITVTTTGEKLITGLTTTVTAGTAYAFVLWRSSGTSTATVQGYPVAYGYMGPHPSIANRPTIFRSVTVTGGGSFPGTLPNWTTRTGATANSKAGPLEAVFIKREPI